MAVTTKGDAQWGISDGTSVDNVQGVVTDITVGKRTISEPQRNEIGSVIQQAFYDLETSITCTIEVAAGKKLPAAKDPITIAGESAYIESMEIVESNRAYRKFQITAKAFKNCDSLTDKLGS
jgi:hypothetical protein